MSFVLLTSACHMEVSFRAALESQVGGYHLFQLNSGENIQIGSVDVSENEGEEILRKLNRVCDLSHYTDRRTNIYSHTPSIVVTNILIAFHCLSLHSIQ